MAGNRAINCNDIPKQIADIGLSKTVAYLQENLDKKQIKPDDFSIREMYQAFFGNEFVESLNTASKSRRDLSSVELREASTDAVTFNQMSNITGQLFFTAVMEGYGLDEMPFSKAIPTKSSKIQTMERVPGISAVGDEYTVLGEGDEYPNFGVTEDYIDVAAKEKRGGIVEVTKEAVFGDLTGILLDRCRSGGQYLALNKEKRLIDSVCDENGGAKSAALGGHRYHWKGTTYATFQTSTPWINVATSNGFVDYTDVQAAWLILAAITDPYTGEPIMQKPKHIVVTLQNYMAVLNMLRATNIQTHAGGYATSGNLTDTHAPSPINEVLPGLTVITSPLVATRMTTDTDWYLGDLSKTCCYYENWQITPEEAPPNNREEFRRDILHAFKFSEKGTAAVINPRYICESRA